MKLLLYTHILLWAVLEPGKLNQGLREALESPDMELLISTASAWEIATKWRLGPSKPCQWSIPWKSSRRF
jgi:PIN domain nuclease of toxin-antitoxin system